MTEPELEAALAAFANDRRMLKEQLPLPWLARDLPRWVAKVRGSLGSVATRQERVPPGGYTELDEWDDFDPNPNPEEASCSSP